MRLSAYVQPESSSGGNVKKLFILVFFLCCCGLYAGSDSVESIPFEISKGRERRTTIKGDWSSREFPEISIQTHAFERLCRSLLREQQRDEFAVNLCRIARLRELMLLYAAASFAVASLLFLLAQKKIYEWQDWLAIRSFSEGWWAIGDSNP